LRAPNCSADVCRQQAQSEEDAQALHACLRKAQHRAKYAKAAAIAAAMMQLSQLMKIPGFSMSIYF